MLAKFMTFKQVAQNTDKLSVLLLGSIEQHGPFLPIGTDTLIAEALSEGLEKKLGDKLIILPVLSFGCSKEHSGFAGTITFEFQTYMNLVKEIIKSLIDCGFKKVLLVPTHGGNVLVAQLIQAEWNYVNTKSKVEFICPIDVSVDQKSRELFGGSELHAGSSETSIMAYLYSNIVTLRGVKRGNRFKPDNKDVFTVFTSREKTKLGVFNFSQKLEIDPKKGKELFEFMLEHLCMMASKISPKMLK